MSETMNSREVEVYRQDMRERVTRIETILERVERHLDKLNGRTQKLENCRYWMSGGMALIGLLIIIMKGAI